MRLAMASALSGAFTLGVVGVLFFIGSGSVMNPPPDLGANDSGAVQGLAFAGLASIVAVLSSCLLFPTAAAILEHKRTFSRKLWSRYVLFGLSAISLGVSAIASLALGYPPLDFGLIFTLAILVFSMSTIMLIPSSYLWLWVARVT